MGTAISKEPAACRAAEAKGAAPTRLVGVGGEDDIVEDRHLIDAAGSPLKGVERALRQANSGLFGLGRTLQGCCPKGVVTQVKLVYTTCAYL